MNVSKGICPLSAEHAQLQLHRCATPNASGTGWLLESLRCFS